jgi:hypothetical protein
MPDQSSMHLYLNWTKERIDEMDAALASLETKMGQAKVEAKAKTEKLVADLKRRRDEFQAKVMAEAEAGEAALQTNKAQLESQWHGFEAQIKSYFETVGKQVEQQQATFRDVAAAQANAWREAADKFHAAAAQVAAARRTELDAAVEQMKVDAAHAGARLQKLKEAGGDSWTSLSSALADSRKAFDRANQDAWNAFKRAAAPNA